MKKRYFIPYEGVFRASFDKEMGYWAFMGVGIISFVVPNLAILKIAQVFFL